MLGSNLTDIEMFDFNGRSSTHGVDLPDRENLSEVGRCRSAGRQPHGCGCQAYRDVLAASPRCDTAPPTHGMPLWLLLLPASGRHYRGCRAAGPAEPPHSATCSTCRGSGLVSGSCQKIIVEVRVIAPTQRNVACSAAVALLLSVVAERGQQAAGRRSTETGGEHHHHRQQAVAGTGELAVQSRRVTVFITVNCSELTAPKNASCSRRRPGAGPVSSG